MKILAQSNWWTVNKTISKVVWVEASLLLSDLCDKYEYFSNRNELIIYEWLEYFYNTAECIEEDTTLSYKVQKRCIDILETNWLIKTKLMWVPAKLHFTICEDKILLLLQSSIAEKSKLVLPKSETNNNKQIIINKNNKEVIKDFTNPFDFLENIEEMNFLEVLCPNIDRQRLEKIYLPTIIEYYKSKNKEIKNPKNIFRNWIKNEKDYKKVIPKTREVYMPDLW